jgi:hypothetical protein
MRHANSTPCQKKLLILAVIAIILSIFPVRIPGQSGISGLDFPGNAGVATTMRFRFTNPLAIYPATYIWTAYPRQQNGYYTTFFWGNDNGCGCIQDFTWDNGNANTFYGAHPYPWPDTWNHRWEIATDGGVDWLSNESVVYDRWYTQALVAWADSQGYKHTTFYWDLPDTSKVVDYSTQSGGGPTYGNKNPPFPALNFGDAPWNPGNEVYDGILRGFQIYSTRLSLADIQSEANSPLSTSAGASNIWYLNLNPTPTDISDKSGRGHNPAWVGSERPTLFTGGGAPPPPADTTPPSVSITSPANGSSVSGTITASANASDNVGVAGVQFQLDGANLGSEATATPYSVSWNTTTASSASHTLTAIARDAAGNRTTSSPVTVTVSNTTADTTPPTVSMTAPAGGSTVSGTVTVSANASDNVGVAGVQFKLDGNNLGAEDTASPYSISWNSTTAANGSHTLSAVARDAAGNQATAAPVTVTVSNTSTTFDFSISNGGNKAATQGQSTSNTVTATLSSGTAQTVSFAASGLPSGATASFSPASCVPTCTSTVTIATSTSTPTGSYTVTITGTAGTLSHSTSFTLTVSAPASSTSFTQKCAQSGVINCFSFDSSSSLFYTWPTGTQCDAVFAGQTNNTFGGDRAGPGNTAATVQNGQCVYPVIDTTTSHSGGGSLEFTIPSNSSANSSGFFTEPFKRNSDGTFPYIGPGSPLGSVFYFQFYQKLDSNFVNTDYLCLGGECGGWKQIIWYGNPPNGSSAGTLETTMNNGWQRGVPQMYGQQGTDDYGVEDAINCTYANATSQGGSGSGFSSRPNYFAPLNPTCRHYVADQWIEFTGRVEIIGASDAPSSHVQLWVNGQPAVDYPSAKVQWGTDGGAGFGQFQITPYHTNKDSSQATPVGHTWYDDLIISTQPIAMMSGTADTTPPSVSISSPANGSTASGTVTVSANASDNVGVVGLQFQLDGANLGAEDTASPYSTSWNTTTASNGSHTLTAIARDAAGNRTTSNPVTVTVSNSTADTTPPTVSITSPTSGSTASGTITVSANASDNVGVIGVQFQLDGVNLGAEDTASPYSISWDTTTASNASHTLTAIARDAAGNRTTSSPVTVTVSNSTADTTPPTVSITSPTGGSTVSGTITVSANASDNVGVAGVQFQLDGANLGAEDTASPYSISWNTTTASNASHTLTAIARDAAGNRTTSSAVTVTVSNSTADTTPPTVSITSPTGGSTVSATITVSANASDNVGVAGVQFQLDGANLGAEDTASPYSISWNTTAASNGSHTLTAIARDAAGNRTTSSAVTVTVSNSTADTTPPTVSITAPAGGSTVSATVTVSANASDNVGVAGVQFQLDGANLGAEVTASPYSTSWNTTTASNGSHTLTAIARDAAGNRTTSSPATVTASNTTTTTAAKWTGSGYVNVNNGTAYFAFKILRGTDGTLSGSLSYYNNVDGFTYNSSSITSLSVNGNAAVFTGTGMEGIGGTGWTGPYNFSVTVTDNGSTGDMFQIQISDPSATTAGSTAAAIRRGTITQWY